MLEICMIKQSYYAVILIIECCHYLGDDHFHVVESDGQFQKGYPPLGDGVENISTRNSRLNVSLLEYQQEQVADCFMGVVEEKVSSGPTRWRLTHRNVGDDPHMDQMELDSNWQRQNAIDVDRERKFIRGWEDIKRKVWDN